eukprot:CAMPEP_0114033756 /NCGR_PEP_ID=MMETSP1159-20121227/6112_1 /TAXON_ID=88271 /ORGANISM="Picocystis salinarum" /LENGTH=36 /assembly_acc=CAM_ASM_000767
MWDSWTGASKGLSCTLASGGARGVLGVPANSWMAMV